jgi:uncharacterized protein
VGVFTLSTRTENVRPFEVTFLDVNNPELAQAFDGYRIVQLSDLHFGSCTSADHILRALEAVKSVNPDLLLLTGDLIQYGGSGFQHFCAVRISPHMFHLTRYRRGVRALAEHLAELFATVSPPDGKLGVFGNHDYHEGHGTITRKLGPSILWLKNSSTNIQRGEFKLLFAGVDDIRHGKPSIKRTMNSLAAEAEGADSVCKILIAHNPDITTLPHAEMLDDVDLIVCGHTHGGQICLPGRKPLLTRTKQRQFVAGLQRFRNTPIYISRGVGYGGLPFRLFCPPEITVITLKKA